MSNFNLPTKLRNAIGRWKQEHPSCANWADEEIVEAMLIRLSETCPDRVKILGRKNGELEFQILKKATKQ